MSLGHAIGDVLPLAVGVALSPVPIIAVVLMLGTPRARANGLAFVLGWVVGLAVAGTVVLLVSSGAGASKSGQPRDWVSILKIALGVLLVGVAVRQWRQRPKGEEEPELPKWMQGVDAFKPPRAAGLAALLSGVNPKNLVLTIAAGAAITGTGISTGDQAIALGIYIVIATLGPAIPVGIYFAMGMRSQRILDSLRARMTRNNHAIMAAICLVIAAKLIGDAIGGLSA